MGEIQRSGTDALASLLTRAREDAGLTRRELAERTGLSYPYISQLETGYRGPSAEAMQRLTEVLGVPADAMVAAMAERDTLSPRTRNPNPRSGAVPETAYKKQSRWIANPAWSPAQPPAATAAASSSRSRRPRSAAAPHPAAPPPAAAGDVYGEREMLVTDERHDRAASIPPPDIDGVVAEIVARLGELPPDERMAALAEIQNTVVRAIVADAAGSSQESGQP